MQLLSDRILNMATSATLAMAAKARELRGEGKDIIGLSLGEPDFNTPDFIKDAAKAAMDRGDTKYTNVDGTYNSYLGGGASITKRIDTVKTLRIGTRLSGSINKFVNFNNDVQYSAVNTSLSPSFELSFNWKDVMEITPEYRISFTRSKYDIDQFDNEKFLRHNVAIRTATFLPKNLEWRNDINYNYNPNIADGFQKSAWFWNATLAYSILKDNGTISLKAYDLLNQNTNECML